MLPSLQCINSSFLQYKRIWLKITWSASKYHHFVHIVSKKNFGNFQSWFSQRCSSLFPDQNYFLLVCLKVFKNTQTLIWQIKILSPELSLLSRNFNLICINVVFPGKWFHAWLIWDILQVFMTKSNILLFQISTVALHSKLYRSILSNSLRYWAVLIFGRSTFQER